MTDRADIALGSNVGERAAYLAAARAALSLLPESRMLAATAVEETAPFGPIPQAPYLNQMIAMETTLAPAALLERLHGIERSLGRVRRARWGPRTIDLDIVRVGTARLANATLTLPHAGLATRDFWQRELAALDALLGRVA